MNLTIYIDVLFLLNMIVDYIILNSSALICGLNLKTHRALLSSAFGAVYSVIIFFVTFNRFLLLFFNLFSGMIIVAIAFKSIKIIKPYVIFIAINALFGGGMYAFHHFTTLGSKMNYSNGIYYINLPLWSIIILSFIFYFLTKIFNKISKDSNHLEQIKSITIELYNTKIDVPALYDTGNSLCDPISLMPVMLIEYSVISGVLNNELFTECNADSLLILHKIHPKLHLRIVPIKTISGDKNTIYAFKPQNIYETNTNKEIPNTLIGIVNTELASDGTYHALLHS